MSNVRIHRWHLASFAGYPAEHADACLRVLARDKGLLELVASNPALSETLWRDLWAPRLPVNLACALVSRPLGASQRETVLKSELRVKVLSALIEHNVLELKEQKLLLADKVPSAVADRLLEQSWLDPSLQRQAALTAGGMGLLRSLAYDTTGTFSDAQACELLEAYASWAPHGNFRERALLLRVLLHRRPSLVDIAVDSKESTLVVSAAGSWHLGSAQSSRILEAAKPSGNAGGFSPELTYAVLALVNNPVVSLEVVAQVEALARDGGMASEQIFASAQRRKSRPALEGPIEGLSSEADISWVLRRSLPSEYSPGRPLELALLAVNPNLDGNARASALEHLSHVDRRLLACFPRLLELYAADLGAVEDASLGAPASSAEASELPPWVRQPCQDLVDSLASNHQGWETMVSLLDEFEGPIDELCSLAVAL